MYKIKNSHFKDEQTSQIVSWGHWFTLFNIFVVMIFGFQYLSIANWPDTFMGRFYAIMSSIGHFSFLCFFVYLILLFPISFFVHSLRWQRIIATTIATVGISILLIDIEFFSYFRMHLNFSIWSILTSSHAAFLDKTFIALPFVLLLETLFSIWIWKKLRSLTKRKRYVKPLVTFFTVCFVLSHLIHIWADANFYRAITMQRSNFPLSYPLTARHLLAQYGFFDEKNYQNRLKEEGNPAAIAIEYPLAQVNYAERQTKNSVLLIVIDGWNDALLKNEMPWLSQFANENIQFTHHYAASSQPYLNNFSLFYGLDPNYYNSILASHQPSVLLDTITRQHYNLGLFSPDGFAEPLYHRALFSNFTLPNSEKSKNKEDNQKVNRYWMAWFNEQHKLENHAPLFSVVKYSLIDENEYMTLSNLLTEAKKLDGYLTSMVVALKNTDEYKNTIIIITGSNGLDIDTRRQTTAYTTANNFTRDTLKVPLIMAWPNKKAQQITTETTQTDVISTLMQEELNVTSSLNQYSQGLNLFSLSGKSESRPWIIAGNENEVAALYQDKTVVIDKLGRAKIYDLNNQLLKDQKLELPLFLQIVTNNRRFMIMRD